MTLLFSLFALESGLRLIGYVPHFLDERAFIPSSNSGSLYEMRPHFRGLYAGVPVSINSRGLRGPEPKAAGNPAYRVAVVGDSVAFGQGVSDSMTLSEKVRLYLIRKLDRTVETYNLGVPGYDTCQEFLRLKTQAPTLRPDAVIVIYVDNDTQPALFQVVDGRVLSPDVKRGALHSFMAALRKRSYAYNLVWTRWQVLRLNSSTVTEYSSMLDRTFHRGNPAWERSRDCLNNITSTARHAGADRVIIIPFPVLSAPSVEPHLFRSYVTAVCEAAEAALAECLDVLPNLRSERIRLTVSRIEPHPSADVFDRIAQLVAARLP